jgi:hypothetical protein
MSHNCGARVWNNAAANLKTVWLAMHGSAVCQLALFRSLPTCTVPRSANSHCSAACQLAQFRGRPIHTVQRPANLHCSAVCQLALFSGQPSPLFYTTARTSQRRGLLPNYKNSPYGLWHLLSFGLLRRLGISLPSAVLFSLRWWIANNFRASLCPRLIYVSSVSGPHISLSETKFTTFLSVLPF